MLPRYALEVDAYGLRITARCVDARSDRRRAHVDLADQLLNFGQPLDILENRMAKSAKLLA